MNVKGQLKDAQFEIVASLAERDLLTQKEGRVVYVENTGALYVYSETFSKWLTIHNGTRSRLGEIVASVLSESQWQAQNGSEWILCDGRSVTGSDYNTVFGEATVPDLRGVFLRGKDDGRGLTSDVATGTYQGDTFASHSHSYSDGTAAESTITITGPTWCYTLDSASPSTPKNVNKVTFGSGGGSTSSVGSTETKPKNVTVNYFIKINRDLSL